MPSQSIRGIPPYAILDPAFCEEFGRPIFAWHPRAGSVGSTQGGIAVNKGTVAARALLGASVSADGGGAKVVATTTSAAPFGRIRPLEFTAAFTVWSHFMMDVAAATHEMCSNAALSALNGWELGINSSNKMRLTCSAGTLQSRASADSVTTRGICTGMAGANIATAAWLPIYVNGRSQTPTDVGTPASPTYATQFALMNRGAALAGCQIHLYGVIVWGRPQPARLALMLDAHPDMAWWWPGKSPRKIFYASLGPRPQQSQVLRPHPAHILAWNA